MQDLAAIFLHHRDDAVTARHLESLRRHNPGVPVTVVRGPDDDGPGGRGWRDCDLAFLRGVSASPAARRYALVEWDCRVTGPLTSWYKPAWNAPAAASVVVRHDKGEAPGWCWWAEVGRLPTSLRPFACGVLPLAGMLLSRDAVTALLGIVPPPDVFCEVRLGTLLRSLGVEPTPFPSEMGRTVQCVADGGEEGAAFAHPVKG
jgi:hypothetical protein